MGRFIFSEDSPPQRVYVAPQEKWRTRRYGCFGFLFDIVMTIITSGFWLIWVFVREMRRR